MSYELGASYKASTWTKAVYVMDTKSVITGFRAFARNEMTGRYVEVYEVSQEQMWVDGTNKGAFRSGTHESKTEAFALAQKAYRWINREQRKAA